VQAEAQKEKDEAEVQVNRALLSVLWSFGKCLGALLPVYLAGYYGLSVSIVLFGLVIYMGWKHGRQEKVMRLKSAMYLLDNEREFTTQTVFRAKRDLPPWCLQFNMKIKSACILQQAWPFIGQYLEKLLVEIIAPAIRTSSIHLQTLSFTKVNIGDKALKVAGVKAHTENDKRQVMLDFFIQNLIFSLQLHGMLRVILEPLIGNIPLVGAVTMFFIRRPKLDINWTGLTNLLDIPGLNAMSDTMIMDAIASHLVLPNRLTIPLVADLHVAQLRSPLPRGVVRIHLLEAEDLTAKDTVIKGLIDGKSDPYAVLRVGTQIFTSHHVDSNLNPQWREMYEVIVHEVPGQELEVEVFDKDPDQDDFLGRDVASGSVHLRLEWLSLLSSADRLTEVRLQQSQTLLFPQCCAVIIVFSIFLYSCHVIFALSLGSLKIPLARLVGVPELTMDQWFQLENSGSASRIFIKIVLRVGISHTQILKHLFCAQTLMVSTVVFKTQWWNYECRNVPTENRTKGSQHPKKSFERPLRSLENHSCSLLKDMTRKPKSVQAVSHQILTFKLVRQTTNCFCLIFPRRCSRSKDGADPYISFILLPDKKATTKRKTVTKKKDLSPEFNERFDFDLSVEESSQRRLDLSVKNSVSFISREKELIGKLDLDQIDLKTGVTQW
uniref:Extended synaptotagmin-like protein 1a n=1 Tax=Neolamprologus brichardi TaxID=32507 RepID=A0A3Q4HH29_NEOBR